MFAKAMAWKELVKIGLNYKKQIEDTHAFFRGNVIRVLRDEGWFEFLAKPRSSEEVLIHFGYSDQEFLEYILDVLVEDGTLKRVGGRQYQTNGQVVDGWACPSCFNDALVELWADHARAIPDRLRRKFISFTGGMNLFNWDDALTTRLYEQIRRSAFAFTGAWNKPGTFLDVGSGAGWGTAAIWSYYFRKGHMKEGSPIRIIGIEPNEKLLTIAREEFPRMLRKHLGEDVDFSAELEKFPPEFEKGYAETIPFDDETFDYVYASQVLHWANPKAAIREMLRVVKPRGFVFGTEVFLPTANRFADILLKVVDGAHGFFYREDFERWAREMGAKEIRIATPISVFQLRK